MKLQRIVGDTEGRVEPGETIIYKVELDDLIKILKENKENIISIWELEAAGLEAINLEKGLWGSGIMKDTLYLMKTDGKDILIDGQLLNPEEVFDLIEAGDYDISVLDPYIQDTDEKYVRIAISPDVMNPPDFEEAAADLLQSGNTLLDIVEAAEEYDEFRE